MIQITFGPCVAIRNVQHVYRQTGLQFLCRFVSYGIAPLFCFARNISCFLKAVFLRWGLKLTSIPLEAKASKGFPSGYSKRVCPPALIKLRAYDVDFSNGTWRTPPDATALKVTSSHHFTHPRQVSARLAPPLWCYAAPLLLSVRAHPYGCLCTTRVSGL